MLTRQKCRKTIFDSLTSSSLLPPPVCLPALCRALQAGPLRLFISLIYLWHITPLPLSPSLPFTQLSTRHRVAIATTSSFPAPGSKSGDEKRFRALCMIAMTWFLYFSVFFIAVNVTPGDWAHGCTHIRAICSSNSDVPIVNDGELEALALPLRVQVITDAVN